MSVNYGINDIKAQAVPCEEKEYAQVCCGPGCEVEGTPSNYCLQSETMENRYSCCFDTCDSGDEDPEIN